MYVYVFFFVRSIRGALIGAYSCLKKFRLFLIFWFFMHVDFFKLMLVRVICYAMSSLLCWTFSCCRLCWCSSMVHKLIHCQHGGIMPRWSFHLSSSRGRAVFKDVNEKWWCLFLLLQFRTLFRTLCRGRDLGICWRGWRSNGVFFPQIL